MHVKIYPSASAKKISPCNDKGTLLMEQAHRSSDKDSNGQIAPGALVEMQAAFFSTFRSASRCWLAMAQAQAVAGFAVARILSTASGQEPGSDMKENDISDLTPCEEVELLHIME